MFRIGADLGVFDWPRWEDLRFPAQGINPVGSTAPPTPDTSTGCLLFSGTLDNIVTGVAQMPHGWREGSAIHPHIHLFWPTPAVANTVWLFEYNRANVNALAENDYATYSSMSAIVVANGNNVKAHTLASFGSLDMTGYAASTCILWRLSRLAASDAQDNDTGDCALLEFDIHYQVLRTGTVGLFS